MHIARSLYAMAQDRLLNRLLRTKTLVAEYQQHRLKSFLPWLCAKSPFYRPYAGAKLAELPQIDKNLMREHFSSINTVGLNGEEAFDMALAAQQKGTEALHKGLSLGLSSGTTGRPSLFVASAKERALWAGIMLSKGLQGLGLMRHRVAFCFRDNNPLYQGLRSPWLDFHFLDTADGPQTLARKLQSIQPTILAAPARVLELLLHELPQGAIRPKRVFSLAEVLETQTEAALGAFFGQPPMQIYQCCEGFLGISAPGGSGVVLNEAYVLIEKEWLDERRFIPIITDFSRLSQPIVRFRLDDVLCVEPAEAQQPFLRLASIEGRLDDVLYLPSATQAGQHTAVFADTLRQMVRAAWQGDYRLEQTAEDSLTLFMEQPDAAAQAALEQSLHTLCERLALLPPRLHFAPLPPTEPGRKFRRVQRLCPVPKACV